MSPRRELVSFALVLGSLVAGLLSESLLGGKVLSPADVLFVSASFRDVKGPSYEPANRLLTDPVLQFQPWMEFNRAMLRGGRLPLWNSDAGCGAPHLANAQSAPFDPFHLIAYVGTLPRAYARMAAARLWFAGFGMFLLARSWGLGPWGRWFAGLLFPLCGFNVVWLLYPVTAVAVWMPWVVLATDRTVDKPGVRRTGVLALVTGGAVLGGHIQTSAHVLLFVGVYVLWRLARERSLWPGVVRWAGGVALGLCLAAVTILPLADYLTRSPVWADRAGSAVSPWRLTRPRVLDTVCTVVPYAFGSQRRGDANLARALGVHNLNESAGGFAGMATALWLAPLAWGARRSCPRVALLSGLSGFGFLGAFGFPPVVNLLRVVPVLDVMDQRRLTLWAAFGLVLLGGIGLDRASVWLGGWVWRWWVSLWAAAGLALLVAAVGVTRSGPWIEARASEHYATKAATTEGADPSTYRERAARQTRAALHAVPRTLGLAGVELLGLAAAATLVARGRLTWDAARGAVAVLTLGEVFAFAHGLNPAIPPEDDRPETPVVRRVRELAGGSGRVLGLGEEWPPNVAMRYGLADPRNYDSVELARNVRWLAPLYEAGSGPVTSRSTTTWSGVLRARERLERSGVVAVVSATPPPAPLAAGAGRVAGAWVTRLDARPLVELAGPGRLLGSSGKNGRFLIDADVKSDSMLILRETWDPGWGATVDGRDAPVEPWDENFLAVRLGAGAHRVTVCYDPPIVRLATRVSLAALAVALLALAGLSPRGSARFRFLGLGRLRGAGLESNPVSSTGPRAR